MFKKKLEETIAGSDVLMEFDYPENYAPLDLGIGRCKLIVAEPELWGVDALTDSAVLIKLALRTRPLKQWDVKRQLLRRIKNRFDALGIELPTQQHTVTVRRMSSDERAG